jgi:hypothetical protein
LTPGRALPDGPLVGPGVRRYVRELLGARDDVGAECARILEVVKQRCPGLLPAAPLPAGTVGPEVDLNPDELQRLVTVAAASAAGAPAGTGSGTVVWSLGGSELIVIVAKVQVRVDRGIVVVVIPVSCDQIRGAAIEVGFAVGDDSRPAGMLAVTEDRPRGPAAVVDIWGDALTGFAWQVMLSVTTGLANATGEDVDRAPLVPVAITASPNGLRVLTMARHTFDRVVH